MTTALGPMYHWSPRTRRAGIESRGLLPGSWPDNKKSGPPVVGRTPQTEVCLAPSPALAWEISHDVFGEPGTFDLWQVTLTDDDSVHVQPMWGPVIGEVRVTHEIPRSRLVWVAERTIEGEAA